MLSLLDKWIVALYLTISIVAGLMLAKKAGKSLEDYFLAGRSLSWWLAGMSMVASAFAVDTPFGITGIVAKHGLSGLWFVWAYAIGGAGTFSAMIFASLIRRSGIITSAEFAELRYSGRSAAALRAFKGVYFGIIALTISMGWVLKSIVDICQESMGWNVQQSLLLVLILTIAYTMVSGFWGVAVTDFMQFFVGALGSISLCYFAYRQVGGMDGIQSAFELRYGLAEATRRLTIIPKPGHETFSMLLVYLTLKWWGNPSSALTQRILSTKNERHAMLSMLMFTTMHFALNYWPMIISGLASLALYPGLEKAEVGYAKLIIDVLPNGLRGLMIAAMAAAFMSTIDTQANWGAALLVNDLYKRFIAPTKDQKHYVRASKFATLIMLAIGVIGFYLTSSVRGAWENLATMTAGYGFVAVARWFWWRVTAVTEFAALIASFLSSMLVNHLLRPHFTLGGIRIFENYGYRFAFVAVVTTISWVIVTRLTKAPTVASLYDFCSKVKPYPALWGPVHKAFPEIDWNPHLRRDVTSWFLALGAVMSLCFAVGNALLGRGQTVLVPALSLSCCVFSWLLWNTRFASNIDRY